MRHLRRYKPEPTIPLKDIKKACQEHLIDIIDKGFSVNIPPSSEKYNVISIVKPRKTFSFIDFDVREILFKWDEVKDGVINLCLMFEEEYQIFEVYLSAYGNGDDIAEDERIDVKDITNFESDKDLRGIIIKFSVPTEGMYRNNILIE